jgi:hypothetical protein
MKLLKKVFTGFFTIILLYTSVVIFVPWILNLLDIKLNMKMQLLSLELGEVVNSSNEMYGIFTNDGLLLFGIVGALLNITFYYLFKRRTHYSPL